MKSYPVQGNKYCWKHEIGICTMLSFEAVKKRQSHSSKKACAHEGMTNCTVCTILEFTKARTAWREMIKTLSVVTSKSLLSIN